MLTEVLKEFGFTAQETEIQHFGSGLINHTWLIQNSNNKYILQRINANVFTRPGHIDENINAINQYLAKTVPEYIFTVPVPSKNNKSLISFGDGDYYRLFSFVENSHTYTVIENPELAFEAARQFGRFTKILAAFNSSSLHLTLPDFHNLSLRYHQFTNAVQNGNKERIAHASMLIKALQDSTYLVHIYEGILQNPQFKKRVTHHDTKISNVLFDETNKGICVIDLDTVMPGYFISDVGDMMRTYLSAAGEEETSFEKIDVRENYFDAIVQGYLGEMSSKLSADEIKHFVYAGQFMIYMQALRFATDYLSNDIYYGAKYPLHNYNRAYNQLTLLNRLNEKKKKLNATVEDFCATILKT